MRVTGIFTGTTNSPSRLSRQSLFRYAIRAGRNLPDKEFRYLRTVIVTAAVHWGFSSKLHPFISDPVLPLWRPPCNSVSSVVKISKPNHRDHRVTQRKSHRGSLNL